MHSVVGFFCNTIQKFMLQRSLTCFRVWETTFIYLAGEKYLPRRRKSGDLFVFVKSDSFFSNRHVDFRLWRHYIGLMGKNWAFV